MVGLLLPAPLIEVDSRELLQERIAGVIITNLATIAREVFGRGLFDTFGLSRIVTLPEDYLPPQMIQL